MNRLLIGEEYLALENKRVALLKYFVLEQSKVFDETNDEMITYGLEIEKWNGSSVEKDFVHDVTTEKEYALRILDSLRRNKITPIHLKDVLIDML